MSQLYWDKITAIVAALVLLLLVASWVNAMPDYRHISRHSLLAIEKKYGPQARDRVSNWSLMLSEASGKAATDKQLARMANDYFNRVKWVWDIDHWGVEDYWATPIETLATGGGDCEDFSIGKYFSLTSMGMLTNKLRITYVKALEYNLAHMVLAYYPTPNAEPLILDNINKTILPASQRRDLLPVYSFNGDGIWLAKSSKRAREGDPSRNLPSWGKLNNRMKSELQ